MTFCSRTLTIFAAALMSVVTTQAQAQAEGLGASAVISGPVAQPAADIPTSLAFPGVFGVASAVAATGGSGFVALSYANPRGGVANGGGDGDFAFGYSIGNPVDAVSATISVKVLGLEPFGDSGNVSLSLSRLLRVGGASATFLGLGVGDLLDWGDANGGSPVYTLTGSHIWAVTTAGGVEIPMQLSVGYGTDTTLSDDGRGRISQGGYVGFGIGVTETLSASLSATETQLNVGFSLSVPDVPGLGLSVGMFDVTDNTNRQQLSLGLSFGF